MTEEAMRYFVTVFPDDESAASALQKLIDAQGERKMIKDVALVRKDNDGKIIVGETADKSGEFGARLRGFIGGLVGMFSGPAGVVIGVSTGDLFASPLAERLVDAGIDDQVLKDFGASLEPGDAILITIIKGEWSQEANDTLTETGGRMVTDQIDAKLVAELDEAIDKYLGN
jgi:uncharacterized membrane protein